MSTAYERGYRKIANTSDLQPEEATLFRSGGSVILLYPGEGTTLLAADVSGCIDESSASALNQVDGVAQCVGAAERQGLDWSSMLRDRALPVEVRGEEIWVCVDPCTTS